MALPGSDVDSMDTTKSGLQQGIFVMDKESILKGSGFLFVCFLAFLQVCSIRTIVQVAMFSYATSMMLQAMSDVIAPALAKMHDDHFKKDGCEKPRNGSGFCMKSLQNPIFDRPFQAYFCFLVGVFMMYLYSGGWQLLMRMTSRTMTGYLSAILEGFGLISLHHKISKRGHVQGLSGMSMIMFTLTYSIREVELLILGNINWTNLNRVSIEVIQMSTALMSWMVLFAVFKTYRTSYQAEMDVLKVKYLIPGCLLLALVLHPSFKDGQMYSLFWTSSLYIETLALLPQVVMMQRGNGKVEAPIAHFVAAIAFSRTFDLAYWYGRYNEGLGHFFSSHVTLSGVIVFFFQLFSLALVGDFMYYYFKCRLFGTKMSQDIEIPESLVDTI